MHPKGTYDTDMLKHRTCGCFQKLKTVKSTISQPATTRHMFVCRLSPDEPLLSFSQQAAHQVPLPVQQLLAQCMQQLRPNSRFGLQLDVLPTGQQGSAAGEVLPSHNMCCKLVH
jgi:hypothetical protein